MLTPAHLACSKTSSSSVAPVCFSRWYHSRAGTVLHTETVALFQAQIGFWGTNFGPDLGPNLGPGAQFGPEFGPGAQIWDPNLGPLSWAPKCPPWGWGSVFFAETGLCGAKWGMDGCIMWLQREYTGGQGNLTRFPQIGKLGAIYFGIMPCNVVFVVVTSMHDWLFSIVSVLLC